MIITARIQVRRFCAHFSLLQFLLLPTPSMPPTSFVYFYIWHLLIYACCNQRNALTLIPYGILSLLFRIILYYSTWYILSLSFLSHACAINTFSSPVLIFWIPFLYSPLSYIATLLNERRGSRDESYHIYIVEQSTADSLTMMIGHYRNIVLTMPPGMRKYTDSIFCYLAS
jgi:hypothetical protein